MLMQQQEKRNFGYISDMFNHAMNNGGARTQVCPAKHPNQSGDQCWRCVPGKVLGLKHCGGADFSSRVCPSCPPLSVCWEAFQVSGFCPFPWSFILGTDAEIVLSQDGIIEEATVKSFPPISHLTGSHFLRNVTSQLWNKESSQARFGKSIGYTTVAEERGRAHHPVTSGSAVWTLLTAVLSCPWQSTLPLWPRTNVCQ